MVDKGKRKAGPVEPKYCIKCKKNDHSTRGCDQPWPFFKDQECDNKPDCKMEQQHEAKDCPRGLKGQDYCTHCSHANDHQTNDCPIMDSSIVANRKQYTKSMYENELKKPERQEATRNKADPQRRSGGASTAGNSRQGPSNASQNAMKSQRFKADSVVAQKSGRGAIASPIQQSDWKRQKEQDLADRKQKAAKRKARLDKRKEKEEQWRKTR